MQTIPKSLLVLLFLCSIMALSTSTSSAQETESQEIWYIQTNDGNEFEGVIKEETADYIILETKKFGEVKISKNMIDTRVRSSKSGSGVEELRNRMTHRYFYSNSGYGLKKGQAVYSNYLLMFNQFDYGFTDRISGSIGFIPLFLFGTAETPFWYSLRYNQPLANDHVRLGVRMQGAGVLGVQDSFSPFGFLSFTGTFGVPDRNITVGIGYGLYDGTLTEIPLVSISGMYRVGQKNYLLAESYITTNDVGGVGLLFAGARHVGNSIGVDYGLIMPIGSDGVLFALPLIGINVPIGKN